MPFSPSKSLSTPAHGITAAAAVANQLSFASSSLLHRCDYLSNIFHLILKLRMTLLCSSLDVEGNEQEELETGNQIAL
jgi:hypothetical protein